MNAYWSQWSAQEIDYCLGRDFRALTKEEDIEEEEKVQVFKGCRGCSGCLSCLGFSNSDFF